VLDYQGEHIIIIDEGEFGALVTLLGKSKFGKRQKNCYF
jgi:hypothetical protein